MSLSGDLARTFDTVSSAYDKFRPGYPEAVFHNIFQYIPVGAESKVLEIGIGSGQATLPFLQRGCHLTAVERGERFSAICREKFRFAPDFSVITGTFEEVYLAENRFDLIFSATAFHWIPEEIGYSKVFSLLRAGGVFARFANHPVPAENNRELSAELDAIYQTYYYTFYRNKKEPLKKFTSQQAAALAEIPLRYGFTDTCHMLFSRDRVFTAQEYVGLLGTYSDHLAIDEPIRMQFFAAVEDAIIRHGGNITITDTIDLELARKPIGV